MEHIENSSARSSFFLFFAQLCVGISIVLAKDLINHLSPVVILTLRFSISTLFLTALLLRSKESHRFDITLSRLDWLVLIAKGTGAGIFFNFIMLAGLYFSSANSAGLITSLLPAMIICLNVLFFKQQLTRNMIFSIAIAVVGLAFINAGFVTGSSSKNALLGNGLILLSLIPEGLYYTLSKYHPLRIHPLLHTLLMSASNLPILYVLALFVPSAAWKQITAHDALLILIIGLTAGLFFIYWEKGVKGVSAAYAALSTALMPLTTVILAWMILGEALSWNKFIGMILVIFSIISYAKTQTKSR